MKSAQTRNENPTDKKSPKANTDQVSYYIQYLAKEHDQHDCRCDDQLHFGPDDQTKF